MFRILNEKTRKKRKIAVYCMVYTKMASPQEFRFFTEKEIQKNIHANLYQSKTSFCYFN